MSDESEGSKPYNDNIVEPILKAARLTNPESLSLPIQLYSYTKNYYPVLGTDGVHYSSAGYYHLRKLVVDNLVSVADTGLPISYTGNRASSVDDLTAGAVMYYLQFGDSASGNSQFIYSSVYSSNEALTEYRAPTFNSIEPSAITVTTGNTNIGGNSDTLADGNNTLSLYHDRVKNTYRFTNSDSWAEFATVKGLKPNQDCVIQVASFKDSIETNRVVEVTADGGTTIHALDGSNNNPARVAGFAAAADDSGELVLHYRRQPGSSYGYLNGFILVPLA